ETRHLARELGERELPALAVLAAPHDRGRAGARATRPPVHAVPCDVELPADEPARPLDAGGVVPDALPRLRELDPEILDDGGPEPLRLLHGAPPKLVVVVDPVPAHEARDVRVVDDVPRGLPDHLHALEPSHGDLRTELARANLACAN